MGRWMGFPAGVALLLLPAALAAQAAREVAPGGSGATAASVGTASAAQPAAPAQTLQRMFAYLEPRVRVEIVGEAPGTIQVVRGENGVLEVTASAPAEAPLPAVARSAPDELTLLANGAGAVQYLVIVPRDARVTVARAGQPEVSLATLDRSARWTWPAASAAGAELPH